MKKDELGALVPVAPVVEAPRDLDAEVASLRENLASAEQRAWREAYPGPELTRLRAALAAAEQERDDYRKRADDLEDRWGEAMSRAESAEQRADRAEDKLRRIGQVAGNGRHLLDRMVTIQDILWEGTDT